MLFRSEGDGFPDFDNMDDDFMRDFPQNREAAVKRYFGKIDLTSLAGTHPEIETPQPEPQPADIQQDKQPEEPKEQPQPAEAPVQQQNPQPVQQPQQHPQLHIEKDDDDDYDSGYNSFETSIQCTGQAGDGHCRIYCWNHSNLTADAVNVCYH